MTHAVGDSIINKNQLKSLHYQHFRVIMECLMKGHFMLKNRNTPSVEKLEREGRFMGYSLPGWYPCYRYDGGNFLMVDGIKDGKYYKYSEPFVQRIGMLVNGGHPVTGDIT